MAKFAIAPELAWLRHYVAEPCQEIEISIEAQATMRRAKVYLPELMNLLRTGRIVASEKLVEGANLTIQGSGCDEEILEAFLWIECNTIQVRVLKVRKI